MDENERDGIVVFCYPALGDMVVCHSAVQLIRERFPFAPIDIVARAPGIEVAPLMPEVREGLSELGEHGHLGLSAKQRLATLLRVRGYRRSYVIVRTWKAALTAWMAGIPERVGWFGEFRVGLINRPRFGDLALPRKVSRTCGVVLDPDETWPALLPPPHLVTPQADLADWRSRHPDIGERQALLAIAPWSSHPRKDWPIERFVEVGRHFVGNGWQVLVLGSNAQAEMCDHAVAQIGHGAHGHARDSVIDLACSLTTADLFVGNDSGPNHLAAALGTPSVGVFGPDFEPPINRNAYVASTDKPQTDWTPLDWPSVGTVIDTAYLVLERHPRADRQRGRGRTAFLTSRADLL